jgi:hypothetical protein
VRGNLRPAAPDDRAVTSEPLDRIRNRCSGHHDGSEHYRRLADRGVGFGESLRGVREIWLGEREALGRVALPDGSPRESGYQVHPAVLDSCLQVPVALCDATGGRGHVITSVERFWMDSAGTGEIWAHARLRDDGAAGEDGERIGDLRMVDADGRTLGGADGLRLRPLPPGPPSPARDAEEPLYVLEWRRAERSGAVPDQPGGWLVLADRGGAARALADRMRLQGRRCVLAVPDGSVEPGEPDVHGLDPSDPAALPALLRRVFADTPPVGVVHLGSLDVPAEEAPAEEVPAPEASTAAAGDPVPAAGDVAVSVLHTAQALVAAGWREAPRLWLVTRGVQSAGADTDADAVAQAALWGLGRVIATEHPELPCTRVDLDPGAPGDDPADLCAEILADGAETDVALRADGRRVLRLVRPVPAEPSGNAAETGAPAAGAGAHLLVGGPAGLVLALTDRLFARGADDVVVLHSDASGRGGGGVRPAARSGRAGGRRAAGHRGRGVAGIEGLRGIVWAAGVTQGPRRRPPSAISLRKDCAPGWSRSSPARGVCTPSPSPAGWTTSRSGTRRRRCWDTRGRGSPPPRGPSSPPWPPIAARTAFRRPPSSPVRPRRGRTKPRPAGRDVSRHRACNRSGPRTGSRPSTGSRTGPRSGSRCCG